MTIYKKMYGVCVCVFLNKIVIGTQAERKYPPWATQSTDNRVVYSWSVIFAKKGHLLAMKRIKNPRNSMHGDKLLQMLGFQ